MRDRERHGETQKHSEAVRTWRDSTRQGEAGRERERVREGERERERVREGERDGDRERQGEEGEGGREISSCENHLAMYLI